MSTQNGHVAVRRPVGVGLIAGLNLIVGVVMVVAALGSSGPHAEPGVMLLSGVIGGVIGMGLWVLQPWARWLAIIAYGINVTAALAMSNPIGVVIAASLMAYLAFSEEVRHAFAKTTQASSAEIHPTLPGTLV